MKTIVFDAGTGGLLALFAGFMVAVLVIGVIVYIYTALVLMAIARKTKTPNAWLAWIPIVNIYLMTQIGGLSGWWTLIVLAGVIPFVGGLAVAAAMVFFWWKISEHLNKPGWYGILMLIPIVNLVIMGMLAWGD